MKEDAELLMDYVKHDSESSFTELVERHLPLVYSAAVRMVNEDIHLAQDVVQCVFTDLARKAPEVAMRVSTNREALPGWLYTSARFAAATAIRAIRRRKRYEDKAAAMSEIISSEEELVSNWSAVQPVLDDAMSRLSSPDRDAVILRFFRGEELKRIGDCLGMSEDAARMRINRALEKLRGLLIARGVTLSASALGTVLSTNAIQAIPTVLTATTIATVALGTTGATGIALFSFMTVTKLKTAAVAALILAGAGTPLVIQHQTVNKLRSENQALLEQRVENTALRAEKRRIADLLSRSKPASARPQSEFLELLRLRGEVGLLRKESQELAKSRAKQIAQERSTDEEQKEDKTRKVLRAEEWANVGMETPDAALQTFFWAARHKDADLVGKLIRWQKDATVPDFDGLDEIVTSLIPGSLRYAGELDGMTFLGSTNLNDGTARIQVELAPSPGKPPLQQEIQLVQEDGLWKPVFHVSSPRQGSIQGTLAAKMPSEEKP
jgi:RNA polymerase sigma factor (sigma-70 family)